jgi:signal transduction histidine kinase
MFQPVDALRIEVRRRPLIERLGVAVLAVAGATAIRYGLNPLLGNATPWILFYPAVLLAAWYGRFCSGIIAMLLSVIIADFLWLTPTEKLHLDARSLASLIIFAVMGTLISALAEHSHRAADAERSQRGAREHERQFFEAALASITDAFVVIDRDWRTVYINEVGASLGQKTRSEILGRTLWEVFPELANTNFEKNLRRSREENRPLKFDYYYSPLGLWTQVRAYPMNGRTALYVLNISESKRIEADLLEAKHRLAEHAARLENLVAERTAKLQETVAELESFSYTISHDLRAPLRALESFSCFVAEDYGDKLDERGHDYLERIRSAARRMDALIEDVLMYSKTSRAELKLGAVGLDELVDDIVSQYPALNSSAAHIEVAHPLGMVLGNGTMLTQVVSNLLHNAVKFVKPGANPDIRVWTESHDGRIRLFVQDRGIGVPPESRAKIFGIFQRAHEGRYEGTGIGLAIVKRAVDRMNGTLGVESQPGEGSVFWVELPRDGLPEESPNNSNGVVME